MFLRSRRRLVRSEYGATGPSRTMTATVPLRVAMGRGRPSASHGGSLPGADSARFRTAGRFEDAHRCRRCPRSQVRHLRRWGGPLRTGGGVTATKASAFGPPVPEGTGGFRHHRRRSDWAWLSIPTTCATRSRHRRSAAQSVANQPLPAEVESPVTSPPGPAPPGSVAPAGPGLAAGSPRSGPGRPVRAGANAVREDPLYRCGPRPMWAPSRFRLQTRLGPPRRRRRP